MTMDPKYIEPLVRRAVHEKFPDSMHSLIEILKRIPMGGLPSAIPGIGENLNDAIAQLIYNNIFTIKGSPMDPITELDVIQKLADILEHTKKDFIDIVFPVENRNVYDLFCKLISYCVSMKYGLTLWKCTRILKLTDMMHPLKLAIVNWLRADFCQISHMNIDDLADLPKMSKELAALFISTLCLQPSFPQDADLMAMVRPQTTSLVRWYLTLQSTNQVSDSVTWKLHLAILQSFPQRAARGKKHAFLSGSDVKTWIECVKETSHTMCTDMILQLIRVALSTHALHMTKGEMDWCLERLPKSEFLSLLEQTRQLEIM